MKIPIIKYSDKFLNSLSWFMKIGGITLWPWIVLREYYKYPHYKTKLKRIINHESIHIKQQQEVNLTALTLLVILNLVIPFISWWFIPLLGYVSFYIWYGLEYFIRLFMKGNAYRNICFEREAYGNENNSNYLSERKNFSFLKYLKK